jgi:hypothetical protein
MSYEISIDGTFHTTPDGDVVPAYEGVNSPDRTPQVGVEHYRDTVMGSGHEANLTASVPSSGDTFHVNAPQRPRRAHRSSTREIGCAGLAQVRRTLNGEN